MVGSPLNFITNRSMVSERRRGHRHGFRCCRLSREGKTRPIHFKLSRHTSVSFAVATMHAHNTHCLLAQPKQSKTERIGCDDDDNVQRKKRAWNAICSSLEQMASCVAGIKIASIKCYEYRLSWRDDASIEQETLSISFAFENHQLFNCSIIKRAWIDCGNFWSGSNGQSSTRQSFTCTKSRRFSRTKWSKRKSLDQNAHARCIATEY